MFPTIQLVFYLQSLHDFFTKIILSLVFCGNNLLLEYSEIQKLENDSMPGF